MKKMTDGTSGRATQNGETSILIASANPAGRSKEQHKLVSTPGRLFFDNGSGKAARITQGEALERFARFHSPEYVEVFGEAIDLLFSTDATATARGINREIERIAKGWTNGKRLRMAMTFESWAKYLRASVR